MQTTPVTDQQLTESVIAVPPLARNERGDALDAENRRLVEYLEQGGIRSLLYGGNAVLYHQRPSTFGRLLAQLIDWAGESTLVVPSIGSSFGMMLDQAEVLADYPFPTCMLLPQPELVDERGIVAGIEQVARRLGRPVVVYLKFDRWLSPAAVGRLHAEGLISWVKYAVVRPDPAQDDYLRELLDHVPACRVVSGIGEQPAIVHRRDFSLAGFTSGCVCLAPRRSMALLEAMNQQDWAGADALRRRFEPLEDLRNQISPIRVLHRAVELAGLAQTGPMWPLLGELQAEQLPEIERAAVELVHWDR
jgi:dihydrodipicolinate synthase/N-acetylneuraminate lyase